MIISKCWEMPNKNTFEIKAIRKLILKYVKSGFLIIDPFANNCCIKEYLLNSKYVSNDLDEEYDTDYHLDAKDFLALFADNSVDMVLYDPPYSPRQVAECYRKLDKTVTQYDTSNAFYTKFKEEITRVLKPNGIVISFGWNTNGIGKNMGFEQIEILIVSHGGNHNDTLVTVERKNDKETKLW